MKALRIELVKLKKESNGCTKVTPTRRHEKFMYNSELSMGGVVLRDKRIQEVDAFRFPSEPISQISFLRIHEPYSGEFFLWPLKHPCSSNGPITLFFNS